MTLSTPEEWERLLSARRREPAWNIHLLNSANEDLGLLDGVTGGRVRATSGSPVGQEGSFSLDQVGLSEISWRHDRVRFTYDPGVPGVAPWDVATLLFWKPKRLQGDGEYGQQIGLVGLPKLLEGWQCAQAYSVSAGTNPVSRASALLEQLLGVQAAVTPTDKTLQTDLVIEPKTSWLTIINTLLDSANYRALWVDGFGTFQMGPYALPADRPRTVKLTDRNGGKRSWHQPYWEYAEDLDVPNHVILERQAAGEEDTLVVEVFNDNPSDPTSTVNMPTLSHSDSAEFADEATGISLARRKLVDLRIQNSELTLSHAVLPLERANRVTLDDQENLFDLVVWEQEWEIEDLGDMRTRFREVHKI